MIDGGTPGQRELATLIGHDFARPALLAEALTHPSAADATRPSFERLEFLGDRVLGLIVAEMLMAAFPNEAEGDLTRRFHALARKETARDVARGLDLGRFLVVARGEEAVQAHGPALADAMEAVIAAVYLDGGLAAARRFVERLWAPVMAQTAAPPRDAKTALQVCLQQRGRALPTYREVARSGPAHDPVFVMEVTVDGAAPVTGQGPSKRAAEQMAAEAMLAALENRDD